VRVRVKGETEGKARNGDPWKKGKRPRAGPRLAVRRRLTNQRPRFSLPVVKGQQKEPLNGRQLAKNQSRGRSMTSKVRGRVEETGQPGAKASLIGFPSTSSQSEARGFPRQRGQFRAKGPTKGDNVGALVLFCFPFPPTPLALSLFCCCSCCYSVNVFMASSLLCCAVVLPVDGVPRPPSTDGNFGAFYPTPAVRCVVPGVVGFTFERLGCFLGRVRTLTLTIQFDWWPYLLSVASTAWNFQLSLRLVEHIRCMSFDSHQCNKWTTEWYHKRL